MVFSAVRAGGDGPVRWRDLLAFYDTFDQQNVGPRRWIDRASLVTLIDEAEAATGDPRDIADDVIAGVLQRYATTRELAPETVLVEKTPNHLFYAERILRRFPEARIIEVRRDGRDVCVSMERRAQRVDWPATDRRDQIRLWLSALRFGMRLSAHPEFSSRWHVVRYEDLIADRPVEIGRLFTLLELDADADMINSVAGATDISHVAVAGDGEHVRAGNVGDWRTYFNDADSALFRELADDVFAAAGYRY